eukprot:364971-Chlamydomonas_euryale.AAC.23
MRPQSGAAAAGPSWALPVAALAALQSAWCQRQRRRQRRRRRRRTPPPQPRRWQWLCQRPWRRLVLPDNSREVAAEAAEAASCGPAAATAT